MNAIYMGGVQGVGKTYVLERYVSLFPETTIYEYGREMRGLASKEGLIRNENDLFLLDEPTIKRLRQMALNNLLNIESRGKIFVSGHFAIPYQDRLVRTFDEDSFVGYEHFLLMESSPENVKKRLRKDESRDRLFTDIDGITRYMTLERLAGTEVASRASKRLLILNNDNIDTALDYLRRL